MRIGYNLFISLPYITLSHFNAYLNHHPAADTIIPYPLIRHCKPEYRSFTGLRDKPYLPAQQFNIGFRDRQPHSGTAIPARRTAVALEKPAEDPCLLLQRNT